MGRITTEEQLRALIPDPPARAWDKEIAHLDGGCREILAASPFCVLSTADADGRCDASARGGPPGFTAVLDDEHLALPDFRGNRRLDSLRNVLANPNVGLVFLVPGANETLRVNGAATLTTDADVLEATRRGASAPPRLAIVVAVETAFVHCGKAPHRAGLWDPTSWAEHPVSFAEVRAAQSRGREDPDATRARWAQILVDEL